MIRYLALLLPGLAFANLEQRVELQNRVFVDDDQPYLNDATLAYEAKTHHYLDNDDLLQFTLKAQTSSRSDDREFVDFSELYWSRMRDQWELKAGVDTVFWGKAETVNVVDVINQKNNLSIENKAKLGRPMLRYSYFLEDGVLDAFYLPDHRAREFSSGREGLSVTSNVYEDRSQDSLALRLQQTLGEFDLALSYFSGINNAPRLVASGSNYTAHYDKVEQWLFDGQLTTDETLYKAEYLRDTDNNYQSVIGLEHFMGDLWSVNLLLEYMRSNQSTKVFQNDSMLGLRVELNDEQGSEALVSWVRDHDHHSNTLSVRGSRRLDNDNKLTLEFKAFDIGSSDSALLLQDANDQLSIGLQHFF